MVFDVFSSLAVAGNILQFVDFGSKLLSLSFRIYHSTSGASETTEEWIRITTHLQNLCDQLSETSPSAEPLIGRPLAGAATLENLIRDCKAAGDELLTALRTLTSKKGHGGRKWESLRVALATIWKEGDIEAMRQRLESYKSTLALYLTQQAGITER
jgi:hypothetical protein